MKTNVISFFLGLWLCLSGSMYAQTVAESQATEATGQYVYFKSGSAELSPEAKKTIDGVMASVPAGTKISVKIYGHTDDVGIDEKNIELSRKRCYAAWEYVMSKRGGDVGKGDITMNGEYLPKVKNENDKNRATNRRVAVVVKPFN
ncbi:MAG: OmpA family protein [Bacteroidia bacterium]